MGMGATMTQNMQAMYPDPNNLQEAIVGPKEQELIESSYLNMCDEQDGIKDGILNNPRSPSMTARGTLGTSPVLAA